MKLIEDAFGVHLHVLTVVGLMLVTVCSVLMDTINTSIMTPGMYYEEAWPVGGIQSSTFDLYIFHQRKFHIDFFIGENIFALEN